MKGITPVVAIILLLLVTIGIAGSAFLFLGGMVTTAGEAAEGGLETNIAQFSDQFRVDSIAGNTVYIRNTGTGALSNLSFYVDGVIAEAFSDCGGIVEPGRICGFTIQGLSAWEEYYIKIVSPGGNTVNAKLKIETTSTVVSTTTTTTTEGEESSTTTTIPITLPTIILAASDSSNPESADYVCDGIDDQVEFQTAVDSLAFMGGGKLQMLAGNYNWDYNDTYCLYMPSNITMEGPRGAVINVAGTYAGSEFHGVITSKDWRWNPPYTEHDNVQFIGFTLDVGSPAGKLREETTIGDYYDFMVIRGTFKNLFIEDVHFIQHNPADVTARNYFWQSSNVTLLNNKFDGVANWVYTVDLLGGVLINVTAGYFVAENNLFNNSCRHMAIGGGMKTWITRYNKFYNTGWTAIDSSTSPDAIVEYNEVYGCAHGAFYSEGGQEVSFSNNYVENCQPESNSTIGTYGGFGVWMVDNQNFERATGVLIENNTIVNSNVGIYLAGIHATVQNNEITGIAGEGISISYVGLGSVNYTEPIYSDDCKISNNTIKDFGRNATYRGGIYLNSVKNVEVLNNYIDSYGNNYDTTIGIKESHYDPDDIIPPDRPDYNLISDNVIKGVKTNISTVGPHTVVQITVAASNSADKSKASFICDGTADQVEIQAAIDALGGKTGSVLLLDGTFYINSTVLVNYKLTLEGVGYSTLLYLVDNSNCDVISNIGGPYSWKSNVTIRNLRIDGNKNNQIDGSGIRRTGYSAIYDNLWIENCYNKGISHSRGGNTTIVASKIFNNTVSNCNGEGIYLGESSYGEIINNSVYNCGTTDENDSAIHIYATETLSPPVGMYNRINNNYIDGGGSSRQISAWDTPYVEIIGNTLINGLGMGIAPHSRYARIINNTVINVGNNAIDTCGENYNWVEGNFISHVDKNPIGIGVEGSGICVNSVGSTIINNYIEFSGRDGISLGPGYNNNHILNNTIKNSGQRGVADGLTTGLTGIWIQFWSSAGTDTNNGTIIQGNIIFDDQVTKTQNYGVEIHSKAEYIIIDLVITDNDLCGNAISGISDTTAQLINSTINNNSCQ